MRTWIMHGDLYCFDYPAMWLRGIQHLHLTSDLIVLGSSKGIPIDGFTELV